jgi:iron(III) transport system substrate-binding protein
MQRRILLGGSLAALSVFPLGASAAESQSAPESTQQQVLYQAAKKEGRLTWYSGILDQALCDRIGQAFAQKYPGLQVSAIKTTSQVAFQRLTQDLKAGAVQSDVFTTTDASHMALLVKREQLVKFAPENASGLAKPLQNFDPEGFYYVTWVGLGTIIYNKAKVREEEAPKNWPDLTDPKWKGKIAFGSPNYSGMVGVWTVEMEKRYGWEFFEKLNRLDPLVGRSIDDAVTVLNSGERVVALGNPATALRSAAKGNPLAVVYPTDGTLAVMSPSAVVKGSKNPNAGKLFLEFLLGPEYSRILAENFEQSIRADVPPPDGARTLTDMKVITPTLGEIEKRLVPNKAKWRDTFGM